MDTLGDVTKHVYICLGDWMLDLAWRWPVRCGRAVLHRARCSGLNVLMFHFAIGATLGGVSWMRARSWCTDVPECADEVRRPICDEFS